MLDCLLLGHYEIPFAGYVDMVRSMGADSGAYKDLSLSFIDYDGKPTHCMELVNRLRGETAGGGRSSYFHNADFLWPVITYLGTFLARRGFKVDFVNLPHLEQDELVDKIRKNDVGVIAVTTTLHVSAQPILELIKLVRSHNHSAKIVAGGPFFANLPKSMNEQALRHLFRYIGADVYVLSSEGEQALADVVAAVRDRGNLGSIPNIYYRDEHDEFQCTQAAQESNSLADNMVDYRLFSGRFNEFVTLRTAKSCPFKCAFCAFPSRAGRYTYLPVELVERELNAIRDLERVTTLTFIDDTFNVPKGRFRQLMQMMIRNNYGLKWNSFFRSDHGDDETIELMQRAGCEGVFLGVESGSDEQLKRMNKTSRRHDYVRAIKKFRECGIRTHASLIIGFPGEAEATCKESISFIEEARPDTFRAQLWYGDPSTPIWAQKDAYGLEGAAFAWSHSSMDAKEACAWIDRMFLQVESSVWLPQNGFEQWSTFYLQRKGLSFDQILELLRRFRDTIRADLTNATDAPRQTWLGEMRRLAALCN